MLYFVQIAEKKERQRAIEELLNDVSGNKAWGILFLYVDTELAVNMKKERREKNPKIEVSWE